MTSTADNRGSESIPERFEVALLSLRDAPRPRGLVLEEVPAPRLAPWAAALSASTVETTPSVPLASGRLVVLHDPDGQPAWDGDFRLVVEVRAQIDDESGTDPFLGAVAWSWLTDSLDDTGAGYHSLVGTVTRALSETFGGLSLSDACTHIEVRASWSPRTPDLAPHLQAWYELIHLASGHEPQLAQPLTLAPLETTTSTSFLAPVTDLMGVLR